MSDQSSRDVSLVITTYNHARFLADAIESVFAQSVPPKEVIVVDDGSTDRPRAVIDRYQSVIYIRQENQGLAAARNTGLRAASGRFVAFLDADDKLQPTAIETNLNQFQGRPECWFVYGAYEFIDENGKYLRSVPLRPVGEDAFCAFLAGNLIGMHATVLYRREPLIDLRGFDPALPACEDYDVYLKTSRLSPVTCTSTCIAQYRRHGCNMSNNIPLMLKTSLDVLRRYDGIARSRPEWLAAYRVGVENWKSYYTEVQLGQLARSVRTGSMFIRQLRSSIQVARIAPRNIALAGRTLLSRLIRGTTAIKQIQFGDLKRAVPFSQEFGFDRGKPA